MGIGCPLFVRGHNKALALTSGGPKQINTHYFMTTDQSKLLNDFNITPNTSNLTCMHEQFTH